MSSNSSNPTDPARKRTLSTSSTSPRTKRANSELLEADTPGAATVGTPTSDAEVFQGASHLSIEDTEQDTQSSEVAMQEDDISPDQAASPPAYEAATTDDGQGATPSPADQLVEIAQLALEPLVVGAVWFLVSKAWYSRWETACTGLAASKEADRALDVEAVGAVNNTSIATADGDLRKPLLEGQDVVVLPRAAWDLLVAWYGCNGPEFKRHVIGTATLGSERIEFFPPRFHAYAVLPSTSSSSVRLPDTVNAPRIAVPSTATLRELKARLGYALGLAREVRLWRLPAGSIDEEDMPFVLDTVIIEGKAEAIEVAGVNDYSTLEEALLAEEETRLAVEQISAEGKWLQQRSGGVPIVAPSRGMFGSNKFVDALGPAPGATPRPSMLSSIGSMLPGYGSMTRSKSNARSGPGGLNGLQNLGNTCFMNSALQCLSNTQELQEYFTSGVYERELNRDNPLGMNGQVAEAFGKLIQLMWSTSSSGSIPPREFKLALSKFAPSFSGYGQQDTQELLAFLLDGIHEDLNRIKQKPATNAPDWAGGDDQALVDLARTCWEQYRSRNDSVIVDLFQGQYRSTVVCPDCDKVSITFDPFMYVTTNLPVEKKWHGEVIFVPLDANKPSTKISLQRPKNGTIKTLKAGVAEFMKCDPKRLFTVERWHGSPYKSWTDDEQLLEVKSNDALCFYETEAPIAQPRQRYSRIKLPPVAATAEPPSTIIIPVLHAQKKRIQSHFGEQFILSLTPEDTSSIDKLERILLERYATCTTKGKEMLALFDEVLEEPTLPPGAELALEQMQREAAAPVASTSTLVIDPDLLDAAVDGTPTPTPTPATAVPAPTLRARGSNKFFTIKVSERTQVYIPNDSAAMLEPTVPLAARLEFQPASPSSLDADIFPDAPSSAMPGSFELVSYANGAARDQVKDKMPEEPTTKSTLAEETEGVPTSLLRTGDFLVIEWRTSAVEYFFGPDGKGVELARWDAQEEFIDPEVAVMRTTETAVKPSISIINCLAEFTKEERLGEDDMWYCPDCKEHKQATKKVEIWKVPDVLVFNLKRFSASRYSRDKLEDFVDFPVEGFDLAPYVEGDKVERRLALASGQAGDEEPESLIYDLYAVDNHYGGLGGGHYTAYAKNYRTGQWYDFDDSRVSPIDADAVRTKAAYLLFYRRRTTRPIGAKTRELVESALQSRNASRAQSIHLPSPPASNTFTPPRSVSPRNSDDEDLGMGSSSRYYDHERGSGGLRAFSLNRDTPYRAGEMLLRRQRDGSEDGDLSDTADRGGSARGGSDDEEEYRPSSRAGWDRNARSPQGGGSPPWPEEDLFASENGDQFGAAHDLINSIPQFHEQDTGGDTVMDIDVMPDESLMRHRD